MLSPLIPSSLCSIFKDGDELKTALLMPSKALPSLAGHAVVFKVEPSEKTKSKTEARGLRLCDPAEATGTLKLYNPIRGLGIVVGKDGTEIVVHHSQVTDLGQSPVKLAKGDKVLFEVQPGDKGPLATNVRRAA
eukprot:TRINITY_DN4457_c0_g1_i2.p1 TRINITY_DN4457_c0_g1~~TRINITY_DN4457_c0_g1_i2.p1  ORF type:complete len:134 (+),score=4.34 TRINITY_DN4457_c0_g1_i2:68-469(+)